MNKRQMKKMRKLRLENERLREGQQVRLETEFALQQTNARMNDLHKEICRLRQIGTIALQTQNRLTDQQMYINQKSMMQQRDIQQTIVHYGELKRRVYALEKVDRQAAMLAYIAGVIAVLVIMVAVL